MADAKIEIKVGEVTFSGEGEGKWLSEQLDKILKNLTMLAQVAPARSENRGSGDGGRGTAGSGAKGTLASFLKERGAQTNQTRKFLATAIWLHDRSAQKLITTAEVSKTLSDNQQKGLTNASNCLNQNVSKGFCEKDGKQFFVTHDGRSEIG